MGTIRSFLDGDVSVDISEMPQGPCAPAYRIVPALLIMSQVDLSLATLLADRARLQRSLDRMTNNASGIVVPAETLVSVRTRLTMLDRVIARRKPKVVQLIR
jgi:hypothetical protein